VLLITIDALRADAVGAYGAHEASTPWMDRLAAEGLRFVEARAHNVVTLPSHANILSGRYPFDHEVRDNAGFRMPSGVETLATILKAQGYRTGAFVSAFPLDSRFGLDRGFDIYEDSFVEATARPVFLEQERPGTDTVALARRWLDEDGSRPSFCWVHLYEPHAPYAPPEPFATRFRDAPYAGEAAAADAALRSLLEPILTARSAGRTLVVLTSDHGEALGDHGEATHGIFAYEPVLRVPLVFFNPRLFRPGVASAPAGHVDILPTVLDALALPLPAGLPGRSLLGRLPANAPPTYFEALSASFDRGWAPLRGIVRGRMKYVDLPVPELYDLAADPRERHNLAQARPGDIEESRAALASFTAADRGGQRLEETSETRERLRSLGYTAGGNRSKARYTEDDDPKRLIDLDAVLQDVVALYAAGDVTAALQKSRALVERRPDMALSLLTLAHIERESGNLGAGIAALGRARALRPDDAETVSLLAGYLTEAGRAAEAVALLAPFAAREPADVQVLVTQALALAKLGRYSDALAGVERARRNDPTNAMLLVSAGTVRLMAGDRQGARSDFESALALNARLARAHSSLAMLAAEDGRTAEAVSHWRQAGLLDPREYRKLLSLVALLMRGGRTGEARPYLELFAANAPRVL
jgi:arylsulfatase A-like enzyme/Flp pilus assembly protein TadD